MTTSGTDVPNRAEPALRQAMSRRWVWAFVLCLAYLVTPITARADSPQFDLVYTFGQAASFSVVFPEGHDLEDAALYLQVNARHSESYPAEVDGTRATLTRDLTAMPLPPFADIGYWWGYTLSDGTRGETNRDTFQYLDNRYAWQTAEGEGVTIYWVTGERLTMAQALETAESALRRIAEVLETTPERTTRIFIYPSQHDLASAMQLAGFEWVGGVADQELGIVLVAIPPNAEGLLAMKQDIPHELTHRVLYDKLGPEGYASLPTWLDEGLAVTFEERPEPSRAIVLEEALQLGTLIPLPELCLPFPEESERAYLAYAQSASVVSYLRQTYGWSSLRDLVAAYGDGKACNRGLQDVLQVQLTELESAWRAWLIPSAPTETAAAVPGAVEAPWRTAAPWLLLLTAMLLPGFALVAFRRR